MFFKSKTIDKNTYKFREPKDGYLVNRRNLNPKIRSCALYLLKFFNYIQNKIEDNERINKKIFKELGIDYCSSVSELNAFHKKQFRKKKYVQRPSNKKTEFIQEPGMIIKWFWPFDKKIKSYSNSEDSFGLSGISKA